MYEDAELHVLAVVDCVALKFPGLGLHVYPQVTLKTAKGERYAVSICISIYKYFYRYI